MNNPFYSTAGLPAAPRINPQVQVFSSAITPAFSGTRDVNAAFGDFPNRTSNTKSATSGGSDRVSISLTAQSSLQVQYLNAFELLFTLPDNTSHTPGMVSQFTSALSGLTATNMRMAEDWKRIEEYALAADGSPCSRMAMEYLKEGENFFLQGEPDAMYVTDRFATVMKDHDYSCFRMIALVGLARLNSVGCVQLNKEVNQRLPIQQITTLFMGMTKCRNYWDKAGAGSSLFVIIKKKRNGPYQMVPWASGERAYPGIHETIYEDCSGRPQMARVIKIGTVTHPLRYPANFYGSIADKAIGLRPNEDSDIASISWEISNMPVAEIALHGSVLMAM